MMGTQVETKEQPTPVDNPPPLTRHLLPKDPDTGALAERALCGWVWDRILHPNGLGGGGPTCEPCVMEFRKRHALGFHNRG